jgi:hypothetical protein
MWRFSLRRFISSFLAVAAVGPVVGLIDLCLRIFTPNGGSPSGNAMFVGLAWELLAKSILMLPFGYLLMSQSPAGFGDIFALDYLVAINWVVLGVIIGLIRGVSFTSRGGQGTSE